jgi:hypothetical protein
MLQYLILKIIAVLSFIFVYGVLYFSMMVADHMISKDLKIYYL